MSDTATVSRTPSRASSAAPARAGSPAAPTASTPSSRAAPPTTRTPGRATPTDSPRPGRSRRATAQASRSGERSAARRAHPPRRRPAAAPLAGPAPDTAGTAPFVLLIMVLLAGGLVATLWLSTAAAADSYRLEDARTGTRDLSEQAEGLRRDVEAAQSAPSVAAAATRLGMVPAGAPAVLIVRPDGRTELVGTPTAATVPPAPPAPAPPSAAAAPSTAAAAPASTAPSIPTATGDPEGPR